jgi:hypothetical protein
MESLTYFGISMEYFRVFQLNFVNLRSFHCGVPVEFSAVVFVFLPMVLQNLQNDASHPLFKNSAFFMRSQKSLKPL